MKFLIGYDKTPDIKLEIPVMKRKKIYYYSLIFFDIFQLLQVGNDGLIRILKTSWWILKICVRQKYLKFINEIN